jgi:hypothetical protein
MLPSTSVASRRSYRSGTRGGGAERADGMRAMVNPPASRVLPAANDNKAPLLLRLRRLVLYVMASLAIGWLFWVGLLR